MTDNDGPGYATPLEAMKNGPREKILYVICVQPNQSETKTDLLATVDVDPNSETYCQIIHRLRTGRQNDELHHFGWNICSSCHGKKCCAKRDKIVMPALGSNRIYIVDVTNEREPNFFKIVEADQMENLDCSFPHTTHCLASGEIMISVLGDKEGNGKCDFIILDGKTFQVKGTWIKGKKPNYAYDFWYQPYHDVMISTEWGAPKVIKKGFDPTVDVSKYYGQSLNFFSWSKRELIQSIDLGSDGLTPLEVRFLHDPLKKEGFVGCAAHANVYRFYTNETGVWVADKVIDVPAKKVTGFPLEMVNGLITDILISLDDKFLYFSNWFHGDVRQYDISDTKNPKLTGQVYLGGVLLSDSNVKVIDDPNWIAPDPLYIKGRRNYGSPQMMQLSLDGKRLYVTSSLYSPWDKQFFKDNVSHGSVMIKLDIDTENGGMKIDENFLVDFGEGPDGALLAHEIRYPGGDCTSDIWLAEKSPK